MEESNFKMESAVIWKKITLCGIAVLICLVAVIVRRSVEEQKKWDREYEASYTKATEIMEKYGFTDIRITVARKTTYKYILYGIG